LSLDQNKDGQINRKDMIRIIEAMYDLANEEDRNGEKSPDKRVDLIMQRLNKDKDGKKKNIFFLLRNFYFIFFLKTLFFEMNLFKDVFEMNYYVKFLLQIQLFYQKMNQQHRPKQIQILNNVYFFLSNIWCFVSFICQ